ncbi:putative lipopolysaccharide biosynthesis O-acetyl transferase WbbJ [compost metagenome]
MPVIGDNCYIGPGAKLFGAIRLGDNIAIGANAVVNRGFPDGNCTLGGIPAKVISDKSSEGLLVIAHQPRQKAGSMPAVAEPFPSSLPAH